MKVARRQRFRLGLVLVWFLLFPITMFYLSPVLIIEGAAQGIVTGSFIVFAMLFVSSLVLGRGFCGWGCPGAGLQEMCMLAQDKPAKTGRLDWIKYFIWVPWIAGIAAAATIAGGLTRTEFTHGTTYGISIGEPFAYIIYYGFIALIAGLAFASGRRAFCHYVCWMAPFMVIGRKLANAFRIPSLRLRPAPASCTSCELCTKNCPMSLPVSTMVLSGDMENTECILCGRCVDTCRKDAIRFGFGGR